MRVAFLMSPKPEHPWYPVNLVLEGASVLVVGGGPIAARKAQGLLEGGARVTVVAPEAVSIIRNDARLRWHSREYRRGEVASYQLVISATGVRQVDEQIYNDARASHIPVNIADVPELCSFTLPSILRRGDLQIAVSTAGRSPAFASWVRRKLEQVVDDTLGKALDVAAEVREEVQAAGISTERPGWHEAFDNGFLDLLAEGDREAARAFLLTSIGIDPMTMQPVETTEVVE
jgi:precorrin-2 dehydrogenase / sirohydrochlorin ferrochelatase